MKKITSKIIFNIHNDIVNKFETCNGYLNKNTIQTLIEKMDLAFNGQKFYDDIYEKSAVLFEGIIRMHPFMDGNKRTALLASMTFLKINGINFNLFPSDITVI